MQLSFAPRSRAVRARWILEELGVPYELVKDPPIPKLVDGDVTILEPTAICLYLPDRFPDKGLAPSLSSPDRGAYLQWLLFAEVTLDGAVMEHWRDANTPRERVNEVLGILETTIGDKSFIAGNTFTAADIVMASILHLANTLKLLEAHPKVSAYVKLHTARPAARRAVTV